jgi:L-fuculose-phosphate aldolase
VLEPERERVAAACRRIAAAGLVPGTAGNVSVRTDDRVVMTPTGATLSEVRAHELAVLGVDGSHLEGPPPTSEAGLHLGIYRRHAAGAVVHSHAPMATALSCVIEELPVVHYQMLLLGGTIRVAPYATFGSAELAEATLAALEGRTAALMANHGAVALGADLDAAVEAALLLEWACGIYWHAAAIGEPRVLDRLQQREVVDSVVERGYGARPPEGR